MPIVRCIHVRTRFRYLFLLKTRRLTEHRGCPPRSAQSMSSQPPVFTRAPHPKEYLPTETLFEGLLPPRDTRRGAMARASHPYCIYGYLQQKHDCTFSTRHPRHALSKTQLPTKKQVERESRACIVSTVTYFSSCRQRFPCLKHAPRSHASLHSPWILHQTMECNQ